MRPAGQGAVRRAARHAQDGPRAEARVTTTETTPSRTAGTPRRRSGRRLPRTPPSRRSSTPLWRVPWPSRSARGATCPSASMRGDIVLIGTASYKLSRLIAKKKVTAFVRAPFTELEGKGGPAELEERPRGRGLRRALGELLLCPYCLGLWASGGFHAGLLFARGPPASAHRCSRRCRSRTSSRSPTRRPRTAASGTPPPVAEDEELEPEVRLRA